MAKSIPYSERKFDRKKAQEYNNNYQRTHYDTIHFLMPAGTKDKIKEMAEQEGLSVSEWLRQAINEKLKEHL